MKLYELAAQYEAILDIVSESEASNLEDKLDEIGDAIEFKAESIALIIRDLEARKTIFKQEIDRLEAKQKRAEKSIDRLELYLLDNLIAVGMNKITGRRVNITVANSNPSCKVLDEEQVPSVYKTATIELPLVDVTDELKSKALKITSNINKREVLDLLKEDFEVTGTTLERKKRLIIT